ncbi:GNAT family N-acetyltransferase [Amycolatopsis thermoflava]|uniref:GNAT family N-acetyltransferase n=1 Tax=Amycolatopsis thermoflava TaxID=84480 RepID=UPI003F4A023E
MVPDLPANPLSIELTLTHRRFWWQIDDEDEQPEQWDVSADISELDICPHGFEHVGDIKLAIADLTSERNLLDSVVLGEWALEFIAETVIDPDQGKLHPELDGMINDGPPRMVIVRSIDVEPVWRGHGLGAALTASALRILAPNARLAACRVSPIDFLKVNRNDREAAEMTSLRAGAMLERIGFRQWRGVHVVDLKDPALVDARMDLVDQWWPQPDDEQENPRRGERITVRLGNVGQPEQLLRREPEERGHSVGESQKDDQIFLTVNLVGDDTEIITDFTKDYQAVIDHHEEAIHLKMCVMDNSPIFFSLVYNTIVTDYRVARHVIDDLEEIVEKHSHHRRNTTGAVIFTGSDNPWKA